MTTTAFPALALALALATLSPQAVPAALGHVEDTNIPVLTCTVYRLVDGDTLRLDCDGSRITVRLACIDAPEVDQQPWGRMATAYLRAHLPDLVAFHNSTRDLYGRRIGVLADPATGEDLGLALVTAALVPIDPRYCRARTYVAAQDMARSEGRGIWSVEGDHQRPWEHRARRKKHALTGIPPR
jgi:endonuclease YncB( thermonuclease family)